MCFLKKLNKLLPQFMLLLSFFLSNYSIGQQTQTCPASMNRWQWPTHTNWFSGQAQMITFGASGSVVASVSEQVGPGTPYKAYESCASASDEDGNLVIYTNGVKLWDATGAEVPIPGASSLTDGRLLTGAENATGDAGSAVQGVFITKHPLNQTDYYIFTTDDAIGGRQNGITNGFNYFIYNKKTNTCSAANRLGTGRVTEQVTGTFHKNGLDIWIVTHESVVDVPTKNFQAYLLECGGLNPVPVISEGNFDMNANTTFIDWQGITRPTQEYANERASLEFAPNPGLSQVVKAAATYHCGTGTWSPKNSVTLLDFDCLTGEFLTSKGITDGAVARSNPYDCEFSADGSKLFVSFQADPHSGPLFGSIGYYDVTTEVYVEVTNSGSDAVSAGTVKLGGDGNIYFGQFQTGPLYRDGFGVANSAAGDFSGLAASSAQKVGYGLPNMFIPPQDWVEIEQPLPLDECALPLNLETNWVCKVTDAENTALYEDAYKVAKSGPNACANCTVDAVTGEFYAPDGAGIYEVYFEICDIKDTVIFTVTTCGCDARISNSQPICVGETFLLDTAVISASGVGIWTIDSVPSTPGVNAVIDDSGVDTLFDASATGTKYGIYKLMFRVDDSCEDSMYIEVKKIPTIIIDPVGPFCDDSVAFSMTASPILSADVTVIEWKINQELPFLTGVFDPVGMGAGEYSVKYGVDSLGCLNTDSIDIIVLPREDASITIADIEYCAIDTNFNLTTTNTGGIWFKEDSIAGSELGETIIIPKDHSGTFEIYYYIKGFCGDIDTLDVKINPTKDASIIIPDDKDSVKMCAYDPNPTYSVKEAGGTWDNIAVTQTGTSFEIDLDILKVVTDLPLVYTQPAPCKNTDTLWITTTDKVDATITQVDPMCDGADPITLEVLVTGGVFSGTGVDPTTGVFTPSLAAVGTNTITYTISGNCGDVKSMDIIVNRTPDPTITNTTLKFCEDHGDEGLVSKEVGGAWREITLSAASGGLDVVLNKFNTVAAEDGVFLLEYGFTGDCPAYDTVEFIIDALPEISMVIPDTLCEDGPVVNIVASATPSTATNWTAGVSNTGDFDPTTATLGSTGNIFTYDATNGLCSADSTIKVFVLKREDASIQPVALMCYTFPPFKLSPVGLVNGVWSSVSPGVSPDGTFDPSIAGPGLHVIEHEIDLRCGDTKTITIEVEGDPEAVITNQIDVCEGEGIIQFVGSQGKYPGTWSGPGVNSDGTFDPSTGGVFYAIYEVTGAPGCYAKDSISFEVFEIPETKFSVTPRTGCVPLVAVFTDESDEVPAQSTWDLGNLNVSNDILGTLTETYDVSGCYDVTLSNTYTNKCKSEKTIENAVCAYAIPSAGFTWNPTVPDIINNEVLFTDQSFSDIISYEWDFTDISSAATIPSEEVSNEVNPKVLFSSENGDTVNVKLKVTNISGCVDSIIKPLIIIDIFSVFVPNAFTPNADGINDVFFPLGRNLLEGDNYDFRIYNRWGTLIWKSAIPYQGWDGTVTESAPSSGDCAQVDVYVWKLVVRDPFTGDNQRLVGTVSLIK